MPPRRHARLELDFVRLAGSWRQRQIIQERLPTVLPYLLQRTSILPPNLYCITVALTDNTHQQELNRQFRGQNRPTNVLSFPHYSKRQLKQLSQQAEPVFLGDISLAYQYVAAEARQDGKALTNHIIHLVIHGILHILGHDHQAAKPAALMEQLERDILARMNIPDPYAQEPAAQPRIAFRNPRTV